MMSDRIRVSEYTPACTIRIGSVNAAMRAQKLLQQDGYMASMIKNPTNTANGGCQYGLAVPCIQRDAALRALGQHGIRAKEP